MYKKKIAISNQDCKLQNQLLFTIVNFGFGNAEVGHIYCLISRNSFPRHFFFWRIIREKIDSVKEMEPFLKISKGYGSKTHILISVSEKVK
jgi:hypothetical protein